MSQYNLQDFENLLISATTIAETFTDLLNEEKRQLTSKNRDGVTHLLDQKQSLIDALSDYQTNILSFCTSMGIEPTYSAMRSFLYREADSRSESILNQWTQLKNALIKNQALNKTNEAILNELIKRNKIKQSIIHNLGRSKDTYSVGGLQHSKAQHGWVEQV